MDIIGLYGQLDNMDKKGHSRQIGQHEQNWTI